MTGWMCPKCGVCYAPSVTECWRCVPPVVIRPMDWLANTACTCGTTMKCLLHPQTLTWTTCVSFAEGT